MSQFKAGENGSYMAPEHRNSTVRGSHMRKEGSGVGYGLSSYESMDSEYHGPSYCYDRDPLTGNATERTKPYEGTFKEKVSEKGKSFDLF